MSLLRIPDVDDLTKRLGPGPMRFASIGERSIEDQIAALSAKERKCFENLKDTWRGKNLHNYSDEMILRFARCSPGVEKFNEKSAFKVMQKFNPRYLSLKAVDLEKQLMSKTLFVVPGLKSSEGHDVFYMRPSRYFPSETSTESIIDNLAYCMQTMVEKEKACTEGIAFVANLEDWTMGNFSVSYCLEFMKMLQGRSPVRVRMFIIANPPSWFNVIWKIMKSMLASDFQKKVKMIPQSQIGEFLMEGYEAFLCDDMKGGQANTQEMINDFLIYRKEIEG